jgi:hypothetical protein
LKTKRITSVNWAVNRFAGADQAGRQWDEGKAGDEEEAIRIALPATQPEEFVLA